MLIFHQMLEESVFERYRYREFKEYVYFTADLLALTASPVLWGCVLVRCQDALNPRSRKFGRTLAILLTIVLALKFYTVLSDGGYSSWMHFLAINLEPRYLFRTSLRFLPTVCLLRAVVTEMLPVRSPRQAGLRARSVAWDLIGWYVSLSGWWVYRVLFSMFKYQSFGRLFWTGLLMHALVLLIALAAFFALSRQEPEPPFATDIA
jgi:hypothetical protein